ncbi:MAG: primosomal protein N', partial [Clostridia bacterium]|nr:primosomal protein N' [Clostridia bacterium]
MFVEVIVDILNSEVDRIFDYEISTPAKVGTRVLVPFGKRNVEGYILKTKEKSILDRSKIKSVISADEKPVLLPEMIELIDFMTQNFNIRKMDAIRLFVPAGLRQNRVKEKYITYASLKTEEFDVEQFKKTAKNQRDLFLYLLQNKTENLTVLNQKFTSTAVKKLLDKGLLKLEKVKTSAAPTNYGTIEDNVKLTTTQQKIVDTISNKADTYLLFGVTGSGKTEVYMNVIKNMLNAQKTAIMLVPEISLTPQVLMHFKAKFGDDIAILHSGLSARERFDEWFRIYNGQAKVVVGARSAIFAPIKNVGVIVIDEEHDTSYFSESNPRYSTIEVAKFRAKYNGASLILGSATPDTESFYKVQTGEYKLLEMPERVNKAPMPKFEIVDMLSEIRNGNSSIFSRSLIAELCDIIKNKKQAMLYLNRRGYQSSVVCRDCGNVVKCENCDVPLVYHKEDNLLKCHYCDARYHLLSACPKCGSKNLRYGAIGTQKVVEELNKLFPNLPIFRMDNDNTRTKDA